MSTRTSSQQHLVMRAQQSGQDPQEFANHMFEHNHIPELVQEIVRGKALAQIVESATVKDASGNVVELKNLRPDGTSPSRPRDYRGAGDEAGDAPVEVVDEPTTDAARLATSATGCRAGRSAWRRSDPLWANRGAIHRGTWRVVAARVAA